MHCTNLTKGTNAELETESDEIAEHIGLTPSQFKSLSFGIACLHIVNKVKHSDGEPAIVDMGSSYVMIEWFGCRGCFSGTYADWIDTCHGQVWLTSCQLFYNEDKRDGLASRVVRLWARILGLPDGFKSQIANEFGLKGRSKEQIELLRQLRHKLLGKARAVRLKNIEILDRAGAELVCAFTTKSTQRTAVLSRAIANVANAIRVGSTGAKRTKKTRGRELSRLVSKYNLHLLDDVVARLSRTLEVSHLLSIRVKIDIIKAKDASKRSADDVATLTKYEKDKAAKSAAKETTKESQQSAKAARMAAAKEAEKIRKYANECRQWLASQDYTHRYVTSMPGMLGISFANCTQGWLRVNYVDGESHLKHKVSENDIIMSINDVDVIHMEDGDARLDSILSAVENSKRFEIWTE